MIRPVLVGLLLAGALHALTASAVAQGAKDNPGKQFGMQHIPAGKLRAKLETLPAPARERALRILTELQPHDHDFASLGADDKGMIFYACGFGCDHAHEDPRDAAQDTAAAGEGAGPGTGGASVPVSSPPVRHSKPGSPNVIYLDFNGGVVTSTAWNGSPWNVPSYNCRPCNWEGDESTFTDYEQTIIIQIWERVAEDYAPYDVDVTTEEPAVWDRYKAHAMITPDVDADGNQCPHYGYGGIAYVNVFGNSSFYYYRPAWCQPYEGANCAEVISHEVGHNLGLSHDGTSTKEYYQGHGSGAITWGPIMGAAYWKNVSQWSKGEYHDANQMQDDLSIMRSKFDLAGIGYRTDDYGNDQSTAYVLMPDTGGVVNASGIIERTTDVDVFEFNSGAGSIAIDIDPYRCASGSHGCNLDVKASLYDDVGTLITENDPSDQTYADIVTTLAQPGNYYLHVTGVGAGTPFNDPPSGYTEYGSLGQYTLSGTVIVVVPYDIEVSPHALTIAEGGTGAFSVRLSADPGVPTDVTVSMLSGSDPDISITSSTTLTFTSADWDIYQPVELAAAEDADWVDGVATAECDSSGAEPVTVAITEDDNDTEPPPGLATAPSPTVGAVDVPVSVVLSWTAGAGAASHNVYLGTTPTPGAPEFHGNQAGTTFDPGGLVAETTYYWRIDEVNGGGTTTGTVWHFTTEFPDTTPPALTVPEGVVITLDDPTDPSFTGQATATDDRDPSPTVTYSDSTSGSPPDPYVITRTWTAEDYSGNQSQDDQTIIVIMVADQVALSEDTTEGTRAGSYVDTHDSDDTYEALTEKIGKGKPSKRRSSLDHEWTLSVASGDYVTFAVEAHHTANAENDDFVFFYSTDGANYTEMLTVIKTADDDAVQTYELPPDIAGTVYISVVDTDNTQGNAQADTLFVDYMVIRSEDWPPGMLPPGPASSPSPADGETSVATNTVLTWVPGIDSESSDVYFGTASPPGGSEYQVRTTNTTYDPGILGFETSYYWRIDEVNAVGLTTGLVWSFTTEKEPGSGPTDMHVESLVAGTQPAGKKVKARVEVTILDDLGDPVEGATVTGSFTGTYSETRSAVTDASGVAVVTTARSKNPPVSYTFTVDNVTGPLPYDPGDNVVTSVTY